MSANDIWARVGDTCSSCVEPKEKLRLVVQTMMSTSALANHQADISCYP